MSAPTYSRLNENEANDFTATVNGTDYGNPELNTEEVKDKEEEEEVPTISYFTLFRYASAMDKLYVIIASLCAIAQGGLAPLDTIIFSNLLQSMVDYGKQSNSEIFLKAVLTFTTFNCGIGVAEILLTYLSTVLMNISAANQVFRIRREYVKAALSQDFEYYDTHKTGDVASKINADMRKVEDGMGEKIATIILSLSSVVTMFIMTFIIGWKLTLICLATLPVPFIIYSISEKITSGLSKKESAVSGVAGAIADEVLNSIRTVYAFNGQQKELERYQKQIKKMRVINIKKSSIQGFCNGAVTFVIFATYALAYWVGYKLMNDEPDNYDIATTIAVFYGIIRASNSISGVLWIASVIGEATGAGAKIFHLIDYKSKINPLQKTNLRTPNYIEGSIELTDVVFHYPSRPDVPVLKGVSLTVKRGQSVAIVGHSGCGKSTIIQLICRYYEVIDGEVSIDNYDVRDLQIPWLRAQIGLVGQEPVLFNTTIRENIRYGREGSSDNDIESAARQAYAHNFIMKLPKGYDTLVGERGASLSGGQKQRIAIARALVRNPTILLLDEATSALDSYSETKVQKALDKAREGRTTIIVAHRLSTIRNVDVIYVMKNGEIVEVGKHKELMENKGHYYEMVAHVAPHGNEVEVSSPNTTNKDVYEDSDDEETTEFISRRKLIRMDTVNEEDKKLPKTSFWKVIGLNLPEWKSIITGSLASLVEGFYWPILGILLGNYIGALSNPNKDEVLSSVKLYCIIFLGSGGVGWLLEFTTTFFYTIAGEYLTERLRRRLFENYLQQELAYFEDKNNSVGAIGARLSGDAAAVEGATGRRIGTVVNAFGALVFALAMSLYYEWRIGLITLTFIPQTAILMYREGQMAMQDSFITVEAMERSTKIAVETVSHIRTVASLGREEQFIMEYCAELMPALVVSKRSAHWRGIIYGFSRGINSFIYALTMYYGGTLIVYHKVDYYLVLTSSQAIMMGANSFGDAFAWAPNFREGLYAAGRIIASLAKKSAIVDPDTPAVDNFNGTGAVSAQNVHFNYPTRPLIKVLNNLNMEIEMGKTMALVGESGCGKSTIVQLIQRFYDPDEGVVAQDKVPITKLRLADVRKIIGFVQQEPVLFDRTIGENIAYGDNTREPSMDEIVEAAKQANIHQFIAALPNGYDTNIGSKGTQLSGGQKQRVAIARALIRAPKLLLLDEATSALDNESEKAVQEALDRAKEGRACVVIAHRLSTIRDADNICVVRGGCVTESGTHAQLMEMRGLYYELSLKGQI